MLRFPIRFAALLGLLPIVSAPCLAQQQVTKDDATHYAAVKALVVKLVTEAYPYLFEDRTAGDNLTRQGQGVILRDRTMVSDKAEKVAVYLEDRRVIGVAKAGSARCHRHKHPPEICWRACNDLEDVRGCGATYPQLRADRPTG